MTVYLVEGDVSNHAIVDSGLKFPDPAWKDIAEAVRNFQSVADYCCALNCRIVTSGDNPLGHFSHFAILGCFNVIFPSVLEIEPIRDALIESSELIPISVEGRNGYLWNVLRKRDVVDTQRSQVYNGITNYPVFNPSALPSSGFFRVLEAWSRLYLVEPEAGGFLAHYQRHGFTGLNFTEQPQSKPE